MKFLADTQRKEICLKGWWHFGKENSKYPWNGIRGSYSIRERKPKTERVRRTLRTVDQTDCMERLQGNRKRSYAS